MTRDEAVNYLALNKPSSGYPGLCEAIDMAIAALRDRPAPPDDLEDVAMAARRGLAFGHQATPQTPERMIERAPADLVATCEWSEDANGEWHTGCGTLFVFDTDGPTEHKFGWCYHCGKPLAPVPFLLPEVPK